MTTQVSEVLILNGERLEMNGCPPLPTHHLRPRSKEELREVNPIIRSTACWRGYQGTWEIRENKLFLVGIQGWHDLLSTEPLFADWVTTVIGISSGELIGKLRYGFYTLCEQEIRFKIEQGLVVKSKEIDNRGKDPNTINSDWDVMGSYIGKDF